MTLSRPFILLTVVIATQATARGASSQWLVIAGNANTVSAALKIQRVLGPSWPETKIIASSDCSNLRRGLYVVAAAVLSDRASALASVQKLQAKVPDAYLRSCTVKPRSRMALGIPLIDPSIDKVPRDVVSWTDRDRISEILPLPNQAYLWICRGYAPPTYDPEEGRRVSILLFHSNSADARPLETKCTDFNYAARGSRVAITCAREATDGTLFHTVDVFDSLTGRKTSSTPRCRKPRFLSNTELACDEEHAAPDGGVKLRPKRVKP